MDPSDVPNYLAGRGLTLELDIGAAEYRARYFGVHARTMRGHEFYRVALARVGAPDGVAPHAAGQAGERKEAP
jgi:hypothetical protein